MSRLQVSDYGTQILLVSRVFVFLQHFLKVLEGIDGCESRDVLAVVIQREVVVHIAARDLRGAWAGACRALPGPWVIRRAVSSAASNDTDLRAARATVSCVQLDVGVIVSNVCRGGGHGAGGLWQAVLLEG